MPRPKSDEVVLQAGAPLVRVPGQPGGSVHQADHGRRGQLHIQVRLSLQVWVTQGGDQGHVHTRAQVHILPVFVTTEAYTCLILPVFKGTVASVWCEVKLDVERCVAGCFRKFFGCSVDLKFKSGENMPPPPRGGIISACHLGRGGQERGTGKEGKRNKKDKVER